MELVLQIMTLKHFQNLISLDSAVQKSDAAKSHGVNLIVNAALRYYNFFEILFDNKDIVYYLYYYLFDYH